MGASLLTIYDLALYMTGITMKYVKKLYKSAFFEAHVRRDISVHCVLPDTSNHCPPVPERAPNLQQVRRAEPELPHVQGTSRQEQEDPQHRCETGTQFNRNFLGLASTYV